MREKNGTGIEKLSSVAQLCISIVYAYVLW